MAEPMINLSLWWDQIVHGLPCPFVQPELETASAATLSQRNLPGVFQTRSRYVVVPHAADIRRRW